MATGTETEDRNFWGIVVTNMPEDVDERHFHPMVDHGGDDNGQALVWAGNRPMATPYDSGTHGPITEYVILRWQSPLPIYDGMPPHQQKFANAIKKAVNSIQCSMSYHNGHTDPSCQFHDKHLHILWATTASCRPSDMSWFRSLRNIHPHIKYEKIRMPHRFAKYLMNSPRIYLGTNDASIYRLCKEPTDFALQTASISDPSASGLGKRKSVQYIETEDLIQLMKRYNTQDRLLLTKRCRDSPLDNKRLRELIRSPRWSTVLRSAKEELATESKIALNDYYTWFMKQQFSANGPMMSVLDTRDFFQQWCEEQNINPIVLILQMYVVVRMVNSKKNTLYLQGKSNAGSTFLVQMLLPDPTVAGNHIASREFAFQECVNKPLILINELTISSTAEVELYKYVLGGEFVMVNVKNRSAEYLRRTPVIVTSNNTMWLNVLNEKDALKNRCYCHLNLKKSKVAIEFSKKGIPNFKYLQQCFRYITDVLKRRAAPSGEDITLTPDSFPVLPLLADRLQEGEATTTVARPSIMDDVIPPEVLHFLDEEFDEGAPKKVNAEVQVRPTVQNASVQAGCSTTTDTAMQTEDQPDVAYLPVKTAVVQTEEYRPDALYKFKAVVLDQPVPPLDLSLDARENPFSERNLRQHNVFPEVENPTNSDWNSSPPSTPSPPSSGTYVEISSPEISFEQAQRYDLNSSFDQSQRFFASSSDSGDDVFDMNTDRIDSLVLPETPPANISDESIDSIIPPTPPAPVRPTLRTRRRFSRSRRPAALCFANDDPEPEVPANSSSESLVFE